MLYVYLCACLETFFCDYCLMKQLLTSYSWNNLARYQGTARLMSNSFASTLWMLPFSKYCRSDNMYSKHLAGNSKKGHKVYHCDVDKLKCNFSGWPTNVVNIEVPFRGIFLKCTSILVSSILLEYAHRPYLRS